jgi:hypothetical protein
MRRARAQPLVRDRVGVSVPRLGAISNNTLRDLHDSGWGVFAACSNYWFCTHCGEVAITSLIQRLGWDFPHVEGRRRMISILVCSRCGKRHPDVQLSPPVKRPANGHSLSPSAVSEPSGSRSLTYAEAHEEAMRFRMEHPQPTIKAGGKGRRRWGRRR